MSSGNSVNVTIGGTDAQLLAVWQRQQVEILKNQRALIGMAQAGESAGQRVGSTFQDVTAKIGQFAAGIAGTASIMGALRMAAEAIRKEYELLRSTQKAAGDRQVNVAVAQREAISNLGGDKTLTVDMLNRKVEEISVKTGMKVADVFQVMSTGLSFKDRGMAAGEVPALAEIAASMSPESGGAASANIKALMAIKKQKPDLGAKDIAGFLIGAKLASPVVQDEMFGSNIAPAIAQMMSFGNSPKQSAAFLGALGQGIGDEEGRITANAAITFNKQLAELMPKVKGGVFEKLEFMQTPEGEKFKRKLLGPLMKGRYNAKKIGLEGEAKAFTTLIGFIQGDGRNAEMLRDTLADTPDAVGAGTFVDERETALAGQPLQRQFKLHQTFASARERRQLGNIKGGRQAITLEGLTQFLTDAGVTGPERDALLEAYKIRTEGSPEGLIGKAAQSLGLIGGPGELQSPDDAAAAILSGEANRLEAGKQLTFRGESNGTASAEMREAAAALREVANLLKANPVAIKVEADGPVRPKMGPAGAHDRRAAAAGVP